MMCMNGPPWIPGKTVRLSALAVLFLAQDQPAPRAAQRLVRGRGDVVAVRHRAGCRPVATRPGDVGDVGHHQRAHLRGDGGDALEVDGARIGRGAADDQLGLVLGGETGQRVVVDLSRPRWRTP